MTGSPEELDRVEPLARRVERHAFDRLIMLVDGVFAIAVTLSALEIRAPADWDGTVTGFFRRMGGSLAVYAISFAVVGVFWVANRRAFSRLERVDGPFAALTLAFLALIALVPAADRFLVETDAPHSRGALVIYLGLITALSTVNAAMWAYAAFVGRLTLPEVTLRFKIAQLILAAITPPLAFALSIGLLAVRNPGWQLAFTAAILALVAGRSALSRWAER